MRARLLCRTGEFAGRTHEVTADTVIGRNPAVDVALSSDLVSGRHARIRVQSGAFVLEDLGSTNGTWLDGIRVLEPVTLDQLHVITFSGVIDFVFQVEEAGAAPARAAPRSRATPRAEPATATEDAHPGTHLDFEGFAPLPELETAGTGPAAADHDPSTRGGGVSAFGPLPDLESAAPEAYRLEITFPNGHHATFDLAAGRCTLGRAPTCDIMVDDPSVSRHHATITVGTKVVLEDAGSSNGVLLEGRRISRAEILPGAVFTLGDAVTVTLTGR
jgi:pSer/pThr/pTyr-binding forkhead associated (FHA) protein